MAVLDAYPGLTTEITVNKKPLAEYDGEEETSSTEVTRYIEARSGADFVIKTLFKAPFSTEQGVETSCIVDGNRGPRCGIAHNELLHRSANRMTGVTFSQDGRRFHQNYQFAKLNIAALKALRIIVDDEPVPSPKHERPTDGTSAKRSPVTSSRHEYKQVHRMKQEAEGIQSVKRERDAEHDVHGDSDDLSVVETRSCKRPRDDHEVIVLD
ncbi:hypothetical protein N0V95_001992 [Ascochyta clinopodiicola]|nr:hypothetical protein N0V95_001992 [Ascochyta clinopodiicola]